MDLAALRHAFRARPGTVGYRDFATFLDGLEADDRAWSCFASILEQDVIPVVLRHHPATEREEVASTCLAGAFESWVSDWLDCVHRTERVCRLLAEVRIDDALAEVEGHPRCRGARALKARELWASGAHEDAMWLIEGTRSARGYFISRTRDQIGEALRKQRRQSALMTRYGFDLLGVAPGDGRRALASPKARALCGAELERAGADGVTWCISALPPAHLLSQELTDRVRRMLGAIEELGPDHARVFRLLLEGLSQRSIAKVEGRHPAAISRRVQSLRDLCRKQLLE